MFPYPRLPCVLRLGPPSPSIVFPFFSPDLTWCSENNLALNTKKTREIIVDFRKHSTDPAPLYINGECVETVHTFRFLSVLISANISWTANITAVLKKAQQRLNFLRVLRKCKLNTNLLLTFYHTAIESLLTYCFTVWYSSCTAADRERLQRVVKAAQKISPLPDGHLHPPLP